MLDEQLRLDEYARTIVEDLLALRQGDALSINTEEIDLEFAKTVANTALKVTDVTVKIVVIKSGKPSQVLEFDPAPPAHLPKGFAMLRLAHVHRIVGSDSADYLDMVVDSNDLGTVQKLGHLAEPVVLGRRISVPWCVAEVYDADDGEAWDSLFRKISLNVPNQSLSAVYRSQSLSSSDIAEMYFSGSDASFSVLVPRGSLFAGGHQVLSSGREFLTSMDFDRLSFLVDKDSTSGRFTADIVVFGKPQRATFVFEKGLLVDWTHSVELDRLFSFDEQLRRVGYVTIRDNEIIVCLGGAIVDALVDVPISEELLPDWFNMSLYTLKCTLVGDIDVRCTNYSGISRELARGGVFLE